MFYWGVLMSGRDKRNERAQKAGRRAFLKSVVKILPALAVLGLAAIALPAAASADCENACFGTCSGNCREECVDGCYNSCQDTCDRTCKDRCDDSCRGSCAGSSQ